MISYWWSLMGREEVVHVCWMVSRSSTGEYRAVQCARVWWRRVTNVLQKNQSKDQRFTVVAVFEGNESKVSHVNGVRRTIVTSAKHGDHVQTRHLESSRSKSQENAAEY